MSKLSHSTLLGIILLLIIILIASFHSHREDTNRLRDKYEEKIMNLEFSSSYDDASYWAGYEYAKEYVMDWFDDDYDYHREIYDDGYVEGYRDGKNASR